MLFQTSLNDTDVLLAEKLRDFIPEKVYDIHVHPYHSAHFPKGEWAFLDGISQLGCREHRHYLQRYMPATELAGLYFGLPRKTADRSAMNQWVQDEVQAHGTAYSRSLMVVSPDDDHVAVAEALRKGTFCGIKVYHCYAGRPDTMQAALTEYAPEWMWEILHEVKGVLMLHIVKDAAMEDKENQREVRRLCSTYPNVQLILAHIGRSFNYRNARNGLYAISDIDNLVVDTSAIAETEAFTAAIKALGPERIVWGSDFGVSEMRGRCITTGSGFFWLHPELIAPQYKAPTEAGMTLVGIESLLALKESCEDMGLNQSDVEKIFLHNALRVLRHHLPEAGQQPVADAGTAWQQARKVIAGGTGLLSKRQEQFTQQWPTFFSRSAGCEVWDVNGKKYTDAAGGIGAVLLGYADRDVTAAVTRRLALGSYASLVNPDETLLAERLLHLHPWAGKLRYARTGGEAMTMAVRIARAASGKSGVAFCGYHGWHDWYLAANLGESNALDGHLLPGLQPRGVPRELTGTSVPFRYNDLASFENAVAKLGDNIGVVVMEPMRSQYPDHGFLQTIRSRCSQLNAVLIIDEITSGLRYGYPGALARLDIMPDIVVYAKAMGNGIPFAAVLGREEIMEAAEESFISSSYWTDGIGTAAALAVLDKMEKEKVSDAVWEKGAAFQQQLRTIAARYPVTGMMVGGMPASPTFTFTSPYAAASKSFYINHMLKAGFLVSGIFYLMHAHPQPVLDVFAERFEEVLSLLTQLIENGAMEGQQPTGFQHGFTRLA